MIIDRAGRKWRLRFTRGSRAEPEPPPKTTRAVPLKASIATPRRRNIFIACRSGERNAV